MYKKKSQLTTSKRSATMRNINRNINFNNNLGVFSIMLYSSGNNQPMDYCNSVSGGLNQYYNSLKFTNISNATVYGDRDVRGSTLKNVYFLSSCPNLAGCIREGIDVVGNQRCDYSIVDSYIKFTKDRTTTCITPLGENESILINSMLTTDNNDWQFGRGTSNFYPLDISKVLELDLTDENPRGFGLQSNNKNNRVSRYIFTNSLGKITIIRSELISSPDIGNDIINNRIYLDSNNQLHINRSINDFINAKIGFKIRIYIKQEATSEFREGTADVILEYRV